MMQVKVEANRNQKGSWQEQNSRGAEAETEARQWLVQASTIGGAF